jgi:hypothetical protein
MAHDEILEQEAREQLQDQGVDGESITETLAGMKDAGMFEVPDDWTS